MPGSGSSGPGGQGSQFSLGTVLAALAGGVAAAVVTALTISGSITFNAASAPTGAAAKTKVWHDLTTDKLMADVAASGAKYFVMSTTSDIGGGLSGLTTNTITKATSATAIGDSSITDNGTTVSTTEPVDVKRDGIATTTTDGIAITNNTAATVGTPVQYSPRLRFRANTWDTDGSSDTWDYWMEIQPVSTSTTVSALKVFCSKNGAAATNVLTIQSSGNLEGSAGTFSNVGITGTSTLRNTGVILTAGTLTTSQTGYVRTVWHQYSWTNAMVVAAGDTTTTFDVVVATLPAKCWVKKVVLVISTAATNMGAATLNATVGTDAEFDNFIVSSSLLAAANTVYGDADAEVGTSLPGGGQHCEFLGSQTGTTPIKIRFTTDGAGGKDLADALTCTGYIMLLTETLP